MKAELAVHIGIEGALEAADGEGGLLEDFTGPLDALVFQLMDGHDGVDEAHIESFLGGILAAEIPDFAGFLLAHYAGEIRGTETTIETAHFGADLAHDGIVGSDG